MTASLRRKVLTSAYEKAQKSARKVSQKSTQKLHQKSARQRMIEDLLAREEEAKRKIAYYTAISRAKQEEEKKISRAKQEEKEKIERKEFAINEWYARNQSFYLKAELKKKKKAKLSDDISDDDLDECDICNDLLICSNCI